MTQGEILAIFQEAILTTMKMAGPLLIISIVIGLVISIFQAATQIHEQTLTFVPKAVSIALLLLAMGSWLINMFSDFVNKLFTIMLTL